MALLLFVVLGAGFWFESCSPPPSYLLVREHDIFPLYGSLSGYDGNLEVQKVRGLRVLALSRPGQERTSEFEAPKGEMEMDPQRCRWCWSPLAKIISIIGGPFLDLGAPQ